VCYNNIYKEKTEWLEMMGVKVITELPTNEKFDVVLLNPPYSNDTQKDLYMEYVRLAVELSNYATAIITPSRWTSLNNATFKKFNNELLNNGLSYFKWNNAKTFDVKMPTCSYVLYKNHKPNTVTVVNEDDDTVNVDINKIGFYPADFDALSVLEKVAGLPGLKIKSGGLYESGLVAGSNKIILRAGTKGEALPYFMGDDSSAAKTSLRGESKVVFSRNTAEFKIGEVKIADKDAGVGFGAFGIVTNNDVEGDNLIGYLNSNLVKFLVRNYKKGTKGNSIELFSKIPAMDFTRSWSNADVYSHFGLTDADIEYIEANI